MSESMQTQLATLLKDTFQEEKEQVNFEMAAINEGVEKFRRLLVDKETRLVDTGVGREIFKDQMSLLIPAIKREQEIAIEGIANSGRGVRPVWWWYLPQVEADKLAYLSIKNLLSIRMSDNGLGRPARTICMNIGLAVKQQMEFEKWLRESKQTSKTTGTPDVAARLLRRAKNFNQRQWGNWTRKLQAIETLDWRRDVKMHVGSKLLKILIEESGGFFEMKYVQMRNKTERQIFLSDLCRKMIEDINNDIGYNSPSLRPMLIPPRGWYWDLQNKRYVGGYYMIPIDFIRGGLHKHTASLENPLAKETITAANQLGKVPFIVDTEMRDVAREVYNADLNLIECMPSPNAEKLPPKLDDETWEKMNKQQRAEYKYNLSKIHGRNAQEMSKREAVIRKLKLMDQIGDRPVYHVIKCDSRTRMYYVTPDWNPQADSLGRGTMRFGESQELGKRGLYWLGIKLANTYGYDKTTFDDMQNWVKDHTEEILDSANQPFDGNKFWTTADKELEFLQSCVEYRNAINSDNPEKYKSNIIVHQDGSNNGLQILSLIGRDPVGAKLTNCTSSPERFDIYDNVAEVVKELVNEDIKMGLNLDKARRWVGNITRKTAKRATMTTSYGVTPRGIQDQLINDGFCDKLEGGRLENAAYLRDKLVIALEQTVVASKPIMAYFQEVATALAEFDIPLKWQTPVGSVVQQSYWNIAKSDVKTVMGSYFMWDENAEGGGLNSRKQMLSSSPNVIHSLDAAILQRVIVRLNKKGVHCIAAVHDSFGVHPCNVDLLRDTIRQVVVEMFRGDWLTEQFHPFVEETFSNGKVELPEPPKQGEFDINEVLNAEYFFA